MWILASISLIAAFYFGSTVLIPLSFSFFFAILLDGPIVWGEKHRLSRSVGAPLIVTAFLLVLLGAGWGSYASFENVIIEIPQYSRKIKTVIEGFQTKTESVLHVTGTFLPSATPSNQDVQKVEVVDGQADLTKYVFRGLDSIMDIAGGLFFIPLLIISFLLSKTTLKNSFASVMSSSHDCVKIDRELTEMVRAFFVGNLVIGLGLSVVQALIFGLLGLHNAIALGILSGFLNIVPLVGAPLSMILPLCQGLLQFNEAGAFLIIFLSLLGLHFIVGNVVMPQIIGARVNLNSAAITVSLLFWGMALGIAGFLLAIPLTALIKIIFESRKETVAFANLLAETPQEVEFKIEQSKKFLNRLFKSNQ